jgi:hypothetical protein
MADRLGTCKKCGLKRQGHDTAACRAYQQVVIQSSGGAKIARAATPPEPNPQPKEPGK